MSTSEIVMSIERQIIRKGGLTIKAGFLIREGNKRVDFVEIPNVVKEELKDGKIINKFAWDSVSKDDLLKLLKEIRDLEDVLYPPKTND